MTSLSPTDAAAWKAIQAATRTAPLIMDAGFALYTQGCVSPVAGGGWHVRTSVDPLLQVSVDQLYACTGCPEAEGLCAHGIAAMLYARSEGALMTDTPYVPRFSDDDTMNYKGKTFVFYNALLREAKAMGLVSLDATWTANTPGLALATAVAVFADGRRYTDGGDATPDNVGSFVQPHFRRMALTRAKARALRDALGVRECSIEEIEETSTSATPPAAPRGDATPPPQRNAEPNAGQFTATSLQQDEYQGRPYWKVFGPDMPQMYATYGIPVRFDVAKQCGVRLEDPVTDIAGWLIDWRAQQVEGKTRVRVTQLTPPPEDEDIPF